ncbi:hypothetical protein Cmtc_52980 [Cupriavidus sp. TKC]|nr:hypothetical protein Cmtc_52980 [Cupriavidus sp. TKC]
MAAQTGNSTSAPNAQRQNTTWVTGRPDITTSQPMVPEITIAATISIIPRVLLSTAFPPQVSLASLAFRA